MKSQDVTPARLTSDWTRAMKRFERRRVWVGVLLALFLGGYGVHRLYFGRVRSGWAMLLGQTGATYWAITHRSDSTAYIIFGAAVCCLFVAAIDLFRIRRWSLTDAKLPEPESEAPSKNEPIDPEWVVILIHGTWARDAAWPKEGSVFRKRLQSALGGNVLFTSPEWTGRNTHSSRLEAALDVREHVTLLERKYPVSNILVVGHSHGGNVALYAGRDPSLGRRLTGIVTMGTPFFNCKPRDLTASFAWLQWTIPAAMTLVLYIAFVAAASFWLEQQGINADQPNGVVLQVAGLAAGLGFASWLWTRSFVLGRIWPRVLSGQRDTLARLRRYDSDVPLCVFRIRGDETLVGLLLQYGVGALPFVVWRRGILAVTWFAMSLGAWFLVARDQSLADVAWLRPVLASLLGAVGTAVIHFVWLIGMAFFPLARAHRLAGGGESVIDNWFTDIRPAGAPSSATADITLMAPIQRRAKGLRHSEFYESETVPVDIASWARQRVGGAGLSSGNAVAPNEWRKPSDKFA